MVSSRFDPRIPYYLLIAAGFSFLISFFLLQLFAGVLVISWLCEKNQSKKAAFDTIGLLILLFGLFRLVSIFLSPYPAYSMQALYKEALFYLGFFAFSFYFKTFNPEKFHNLLIWFTAAAAFTALTGIIRFDMGIVHRAQSFSSGYMAFSAYLLALLGLAVMLFPEGIKKFGLWLPSAGIILIITGIITSLGRVNLLLAGALFVIGIILKVVKVKEALLIVLASAILSFLSFSLNSKEVEQRIEQPTQVSDRDILYKGAWEILFEKPLFGHGPNSFTQVFKYKHQLADKGIGSWHNDVLQMYIEGGIFSLVSFLMLIFIPMVKLFNLIRKKITAGEIKNAAIGLLFATGILFLSSLTSAVIISPVLAMIYAFLFAGISRVLRTEY